MTINSPSAGAEQNNQKGLGGGGEFDRIDRFFRPLAARSPFSLGLQDDAAIIDLPEGHSLVTSVDTLVEKVHFIGDEEADILAKKCLRVNLSDLAAMGAAPLGYLVALSVPSRVTDQWISKFAEGLSKDQEVFGLSLLGGDSTSTGGPITISITAFGTVPQGTALTRSGAQVGDKVYVSGTIGDGALGLQAAFGKLPPGPENTTLLERYQVPTPRLELGQVLRDRAHAVMDISDGLIADLTHICDASGVSAVLEAPLVPVSDAAAVFIADDPGLLRDVLTGGDDYELLIAGPGALIEEAALQSGTAVTMIGEIREGSGVLVYDKDGLPLKFQKTGFRHS